MTDKEIDRLLSTPIPGGSQARDWFLPHDTERGLANVRDVVLRLVAAEREACAAECERMVMYPGGRQEAPAHENVWAAAKAIRMRSNDKLRGAP